VYGDDQEWRSITLTTSVQQKANVIVGESLQKVIAIAYAPSNPDTIYFSTDTNQIWKSTDGGKTWYPRGNGFSANGARSLFVSPVNPDLVLVAGFLGRVRYVIVPDN